MITNGVYWEFGDEIIDNFNMPNQTGWHGIIIRGFKPSEIRIQWRIGGISSSFTPEDYLDVKERITIIHKIKTVKPYKIVEFLKSLDGRKHDNSS
jgi:hypothetical protein